MDNKSILAVGVAVASIASIVIILSIPQVATDQIKIGPSYLARLPDGGPATLSQYKMSDGGTQWLRVQSDAKDCARRKLGGSTLLCRRGTALDNKDFGELNRFPASQAQPIVNDCQPVPCAVWFGQNADQDEAALLNSTVGVIIP